MYFQLLNPIIRSTARYRIYLDIKDTRSADRVRKFEEVLANANYDFDREIVTSIQTIHSKESELIQLSDLLIGAIAYRQRGLNSNSGKVAVTDLVARMSGKSLLRSTLLAEPKFNLFVWRAQERI